MLFVLFSVYQVLSWLILRSLNIHISGNLVRIRFTSTLVPSTIRCTCQRPRMHLLFTVIKPLWWSMSILPKIFFLGTASVTFLFIFSDTWMLPWWGIAFVSLYSMKASKKRRGIKNMVMQMIQVSQMHYTRQIHIAKDAPSSTQGNGMLPSMSLFGIVGKVLKLKVWPCVVTALTELSVYLSHLPDFFVWT